MGLSWSCQWVVPWCGCAVARQCARQGARHRYTGQRGRGRPSITHQVPTVLQGRLGIGLTISVEGSNQRSMALRGGRKRKTVRAGLADLATRSADPLSEGGNIRRARQSRPAGLGPEALAGGGSGSCRLRPQSANVVHDGCHLLLATRERVESVTVAATDEDAPDMVAVSHAGW